MAWTAPRTWTNGETITDTICNTHIRDNLGYLKDILSGVSQQAVDILNSLAVRAAAGGGAFELGHKTVAGNAVVDFNSSGSNNDYDARLLVSGGTTVGTGIMQLTAADVRVGAEGETAKAVHRRQSTGKGHIESNSASDTVAQGNTNDDAYTFTDAFAAAPKVVHGMEHSGDASLEAKVMIKPATLSTTGVTLQKYNNNVGGLVMISHMMAEGAD